MVVASAVGHRAQETGPRIVRHASSLQGGERIAFMRRGDAIPLQPLARVLLDLRDSVAVSGPQNLGAIRRQATAGLVPKVAPTNLNRRLGLGRVLS